LAGCGAVNYAELTAALPRSGGEYHLLGRVFHPALGFLSGWISLTVGFPAPIAVSAVFFANYTASATGWTVGSAGMTHFLLAAGIILAVTGLHFISVRTSGRAQTLLTVLKIALVTGLAGSGFLIEHPGDVRFLPQPGDVALMLRPEYAVSLIFVLYAYSGWNSACYIAGELENPGRSVPLALLTGTLVVTVLYIGLNAAFLYSTPMPALRGVPDIGFVAAQHIFGEMGARLVAGLIAAGLVSSMSGMLWAGSRVAQTMGQDYAVLRPLARTTGGGVPWVATLLQSGLALVLLFSADVPQILAGTEFSLQLVLLLTVSGVVVLRRREPELRRPYRAWGYPWTTGLFLGVTGFVLVYLLQNRPRESLWGLANLLLALTVYAAAASRRFGGRSANR
jgi:basic amino acid/polyamine antiporter, APA family